jgi:hypothetical protein
MHEPRVRVLPSKGIAAATILSLGMGLAGTAPAFAVSIPVDCAAGDTIAAALVTARTTFEPVEIVISGMCKERVVIDRDEITLRGKDPAAGLDGTGVPGIQPLIVVNGAHRILLDTLRLTPAGTGGLQLVAGASVRAWKLMIDGAEDGVSLWQDTSLELTSSEVARSTGTGINCRGGSLTMRSSAVYESKSVGVSLSAGVLDMSDSKIVNNKYWGLSLIDNASGIVTSSSITENYAGIFLRLGGRLLLGSRASITSNQTHGVRVADSSTLMLATNSVIEGNGAGGVHVSGASEVIPLATTIKNNNGDGIAVRDTSLVTATAGANPAITANAGWGIRCEGFPGDARLATPGFGLAAVFGNTLGQITCPGFLIP